MTLPCHVFVQQQKLGTWKPVRHENLLVLVYSNTNWQMKQALIGEWDGKLCIAVHASISVQLYTRDYMGRFYMVIL